MTPCEHANDARAGTAEGPSWFTKPGPTESFLRTAPAHLLQDNGETAPPVRTDPELFTTVGPTRSFVQSR